MLGLFGVGNGMYNSKKNLIRFFTEAWKITVQTGTMGYSRKNTGMEGMEFPGVFKK